MVTCKALLHLFLSFYLLGYVWLLFSIVVLVVVVVVVEVGGGVCCTHYLFSSVAVRMGRPR